MAAAVVVLVAARPQTAIANEYKSSTSESGVTGLPFSAGDLGWLFFAAVVLLALMIVLQAVVRRRRALRAVARERTDP